MKGALYSRRTRRRLGKAESLRALADAKQATPKPPADRTMSPWIRFASGIVALLVLAGTATIAAVVVGTQVGFYRAKMGVQVVDFSPLPIPAIDLPVFTPLATEGVVWMCTLMAVVLVLLNRPARLWTQSMWLFAAVAAFVNTFKAVWLEHEPLGGVVTGGLSIAGPYTVHLFVIWVRHLRTGRTLEQVRIDTELRWAAWGQRAQAASLRLLDHTVHPITAARTIWVWRAFRGITYRQAWIVASRPVRQSILKRYAVNPADGVRSVEEQFLADLHDDATITATLHRWTGEVLGGGSQGSTSGNTVTLTPDEHPAQGPSHTPKRALPRRASRRPKRASRPADTGAQDGVSKQEKVIAEYWRRREQGESVEGVNLSELARELFGDPATRATVSKTWKACLNGEHPNPNGDGQ